MATVTVPDATCAHCSAVAQLADVEVKGGQVVAAVEPAGWSGAMMRGASGALCRVFLCGACVDAVGLVALPPPVPPPAPAPAGV